MHGNFYQWIRKVLRALERRGQWQWCLCQGLCGGCWNELRRVGRQLGCHVWLSGRMLLWKGTSWIQGMHEGPLSYYTLHNVIALAISIVKGGWAEWNIVQMILLNRLSSVQQWWCILYVWIAERGSFKIILQPFDNRVDTNYINQSNLLHLSIIRRRKIK